ncbi:uncharacterized protein LOC143280802 [Babylonia areolata]|uniref:uncharacterized protein LOC143280802 n=1 Tax=Babylonia areolata TaxID=304850 RepID=UPI003FCF1072
MHVQLYIPPRSAGGGLPVTRNMPYSQPSMPSQSQPRNMTGIYLGLEGNINPPRPKTGIPPLARTRGSSRMRTTTEEQRYRRVELLRIKEEKRGFSGNPVKRHQQGISAQNDHHHHHHQQHSNSSAVMISGGVHPSSGHAPRGSLTYPGVSSATITTTTAFSDVGATSSASDHSHGGRRWGPGKRIDPANLDDLLRPNPRNYTTVANSGVTRSEKLTGWMGGGYHHHHHHHHSSLGEGGGGGGGGGGNSNNSDLAREVGRVSGDDLAGLEECFRKVCKGNVDVLYSLLPGRKAQPVRRENTGFTVRSYRNPNRAEILADFSSSSSSFSGQLQHTGAGAGVRADRPKTVPYRRPLVPQPYFYRHHSTHPGASAIAAASAATSSSSAVHKKFLSSALTAGGGEDPKSQYFNSTSRILASPGAGTISRPLTQRLQSASTVLPASASLATHRTESPPTRHTTSPTGDPDKEAQQRPKGFQSGESTSRAGQDSEDPAAHTEPAAAATGGAAVGHGRSLEEEGGEGEEGAALTPAKQVHVAVVPRPLDVTADSINTTTTTWEDSVTPRPASDPVTPRPLQEGHLQEAEEEEEGAMEGADASVAEVKVFEDGEGSMVSTTEDERPRPKLTASNSGADIMLGLETDEGQSAEVEIDTADQEELMPEAEVPKGRVRKASITEKVIKTKASEAMAAMIKEEAESRQREFEKLLDEHAELVQEISRTPSSENLIQGERDH